MKKERCSGCAPESVAGVRFTASHVETHLLREVPLFLEKVLQSLRHLRQLLKSAHPRLNVVKVHLSASSCDINSHAQHSRHLQAFPVTCHWVCKPAYLLPFPRQDKVGGLWQEGHPA